METKDREDVEIFVWESDDYEGFIITDKRKNMLTKEVFRSEEEAADWIVGRLSPSVIRFM